MVEKEAFVEVSSWDQYFQKYVAFQVNRYINFSAELSSYIKCVSHLNLPGPGLWLHIGLLCYIRLLQIIPPMGPYFINKFESFVL